MRSICVALSAALFVLLLTPSAVAWSNGGYSADQGNPDYGTHDWVAEKALDLQTRDVTFLATTYHARYLLGTEAPDNPEFIGDSAKHHVYYRSGGQLQDDASALRASALYQTALGYMKSGDYEIAAFDIGSMAHYISDMGVFGHTMGAYTDWGSETHHSDYESEFETRLDSLPEPSGISLGDIDAYNATLNLARTTTFGSGFVKANTWMDANYDWSNTVFESSAIASLNKGVEAVAAVINHLMHEANPPPPPPEPEPDPEPDPEPYPTYSLPGAPRSLTVIVENADVILSWSPPSSDGGASVTRYLIYMSTDPGNPSYAESVIASVLNWTYEDAPRGVTLYYWVVAENAVGRGNMSEPISIMVEKGSTSSQLLPVIVVGLSGIIAAAGAVLWHRSSRAKR